MYVEYEPGLKHGKSNPATSDKLDSFRDAGELISDDDIIVDIDSLPMESIKKLISIFHLKTETVWTDRGVHLVFQKPEIVRKPFTRICALGFNIEIKTSKNLPNGITIKRNGIARTVENAGKRMAFPRVFDIKKSFDNLVGMGDSSGRNNALIKLRAQLKAEKDWAQYIRFVNNFVFSEPLEDKELQTIMRPGIKFDDKDTTTGQIGKWFADEFETVIYSGSIWYKVKNEYIKSDAKDLALKKMIADKCGDRATPKLLNDTVSMIEVESKKPADNGFPIKFKNGYLKDGEFYDEDIDEFTPYSIDINYKPDAEPVPIVDAYLDNLTKSDKEYRDYLMEVLGMCLITNAETKRAIAKLFIFRGDGGNGKGTLLQVISKILGSGNVTNLSIKNLTDTYAAADMIGKLANLGDDIEGSTLDDEQVRMLKNISTCDTFKVREIYKAPVMMTMTATMIFTTNNTIRTFEKSNAISRRIRWLPMFSKVDKPDPLIITKLTTKKALEYWMSLIVPGYMRLYKNTSFSHCAVIENYTADYQEENDLALKWIKDTDPEEDIHNHTMKDVKQSFTNWIEDSGEDMPKYISSRQLKQTIWNQLKMGVSAKKVGKSTSRIFMKSNETDQIIEPK